MRKIKLHTYQVKRQYSLAVQEITKKCMLIVSIKITREDMRQLQLVGVKFKKK